MELTLIRSVGFSLTLLLFTSTLYDASFAKLEESDILQESPQNFFEDLLANALSPRETPVVPPLVEFPPEDAAANKTLTDPSNQLDNDNNSTHDSEGNSEIDSESTSDSLEVNILEVNAPKGKRGDYGESEFDTGEDLKVDRRQSGRSQPQYNPKDLTPENRQGGLKPGGLLPPWKDSDEPPTPFPPETGNPTDGETTETPEPTVSTTTEDPGPEMPEDWRQCPKIPIDSSDIFDNCGKIRAPPKESGGSESEQKRDEEVPKTCLAIPSGCADKRTCRVAAAISLTPKKVIRSRRDAEEPGEVEIDPGKTSGWIRIRMEATAPEGFVAIGFSHDIWMGDDFVMYCGQGPLGHLVTLHMSHNKKYENVMEKDKEKFAARVRRRRGYAQDNGVVACDFDVLFPNPNAPVEGGSDKEWHVFLAFGKLSNFLDFNDTNYGTLLFHHMAVVSDTKVSLDSLHNNPQVLGPKNRELIRNHGILCLAAFALFVPWSMFFAQYGREAYSNICFKNIPQWAFMHLLFSVMGLVLAIPGTIVIAAELEWEWRSVGGKAVIHSILGLAGVVVLVGNFVIGAVGFGVQGTTRRYKSIVERLPGDQIEAGRLGAHYFRWVHWYLGQCVYIFGMGSLFMAPSVRRAYIPCAVMYVAGLQVVIHFLTHIYMALHTYQLVMEIDGKYVLRRVLPGPMLPWVENDLLAFETDKEFYALEIWEGRRIAIKFYCATSLICVAGIIVLTGHFVPLVLCRRHIGAPM